MKTAVAVFIVLIGLAAAVQHGARAQVEDDLGFQPANQMQMDQNGNPILENCLVTIKEEVHVPAEEPGVVVELAVKDGQPVGKDQIIAQIDDKQAKMQFEVAQYQFDRASTQAENDVNIRYAEKAMKVAGADLKMARDGNENTPGTFPVAELMKRAFEVQRTELQIEQASFEQKLAVLDTHTAGAEVKAARMGIERRKVKAPLNGLVEQVHVRKGDWVNPGDPVAHVVRLDVLRIEGFVNRADYNPVDVIDRRVTIQVELANGKIEPFAGKIAYVSQLVQTGGVYRIRAEVENRKDKNLWWRIYPGLNARMTILINDPGR